MGNISSMARASTALDSYVAELGNDISYDKSLSSSRFLKTILARHAYGPIVLKIFIKPDSTMSLRLIQNRLKKERDALKDLPGTSTYQAFVETEKAGYLIRQWVGSNLYDRVSTQPYLAGIEKKWIAFQLLTSLRDARILSVAHGDIKSENVLITTDLSVLLTDFSSAFKPTYLPLDDPSDFSFFFDTSARRTCYIAPERFYSADSPMASSKRATSSKATDTSNDAWSKRDPPPTEYMDVFSAGCVLAEMWTDGRTVFNLSELYAYKDGSLSLDGILDNIEDRHVREMIRQMLSKNPEDRPSFDLLLSEYRDSIFPEYFYTFLKDYVASLSELPASSGQPFLNSSAGLAGTKIDRMLDEWDSISVHLNRVDENGPALLLLNIVTSSIRNCLWPSSRLHGLELFLHLSLFLLDEDKIDRIIPFIVELLSDDVAIVRAEACRILVTIVESISSITPFNAPFIPEYLLPQMRHLSVDPDVFVRATYAKSLVKLSDAAVKMLEMSQARIMDEDSHENYDSMLLEIQSIVEEQATTLLVDSSSNVKRAMLADISDLCLFFGRQKSNETVLSHMMTYLNDRDWHLRLAFFDGIVGVGAFIGIRAIEDYVLPLMLQALADSEEAVVARVVSSLTSLAALGLLSRMRLWDVFFAIRGFLCHPDAWIRQSTVGFVAAAARNLPSSDTWCILYPALRTSLQGDVAELDEESILSSLATPLRRSALVAAKNAALANSPPGFWDIPHSSLSAKAQLIKSALSTSDSTSLQLKSKGISAKDEKKIVAMKDFILKQAHASRAREITEQQSANDSSLVSNKSVPLGELGITPQTVFISPRTVGVDATANLRRLRPHLKANDASSSRRTSFASKTNTPMDDMRKRLTSVDPPLTASKTPSHRSGPSTSTIPGMGESPSESGISASLEMAALARPAKRRVEPKVAPAIAAIHTTAMGTTSIHDDSMSGRSTPTPRAVSTTAYGSTYEGQDPGVRAFLDQVDLDNYREPQIDFGPRVVSTTRKRRIKPPTGPGGQGSGITLIAQMSDHKAAITGLVASPDHMFFASASEDHQLMIWDSARLERSVITKPRLTYSMNAPISCLGRIENTHCLAVGSEDGQLVILRVHVAGNKYSKIENIRSFQMPAEEGYVKFLAHQDGSILIISSKSAIAVLDIRTMEITKRYNYPLEHGIITSVCIQKHWLVIGTEIGVLSLWDLRFGILLKSWMASGRVTSMDIHPLRGKGLWLICGIERKADEDPIVEVYDIETHRLVETFEIRSNRPTKSGSLSIETPIPDKTALIEQIANASTSTPTSTEKEDSQSVLAMLVGHRFHSMVTAPSEETGGLMSSLSLTERDRPAVASPGYMITAGEDRIVRYWDLAKAGEGFVICGSQKEKEVVFKQSTGSNPTLYYTLPTRPNDKSSSNKIPPQPLRPHYDAICALGHIETPFSSCVISADRSGVLKVWRMEGGQGKV